MNGETILLHAEQGWGDTIQFVRFAPMVAARGGRVIVECQPELARLLKTAPGVEQIVIKGQPLPPFNVQCALMSLPLAFGVRLETIPGQVPYLSADPTLVQVWDQKMGARHKPLRIGVAWAGSPTHPNDRNRSLRLAQLAPLAGVKNITFHSLQTGPPAAEAAAPPPGMELIDHSVSLQDFADTAALLAHLDLVICVDTAVAHLAGAMGKPVWLILPLAPDWRWLLEREDNPWYPTIRLFRQKTLGTWDDVISRIVQALAQWVDASLLQRHSGTTP